MFVDIVNMSYMACDLGFTGEKQVDIKKIGGGGRVCFIILSSLPQIKIK
jgi:hypothetical protein